MDFNPQTHTRRTDEAAERAAKLSYNAEEARKALGIGQTKLMELVRGGEIECVKLGKVNLFPATSLEAFLATLPKRTGFVPQKRAA